MADKKEQIHQELKFARNSMSCNYCGNANPKYRCPRCDLKSCSLNCVKNHKLENGCTGQRDKTEFVKKSEYTEKHLLNDYRFLEEVNRVADNANRDHRSKLKFFSKNAKELRNKADKKGINLKLLPVGFKKRMENTSFYHYRSKVIRWKVKLMFPQANAEYFETRVSEREKMRKLIEKYIDPIHADPVYKQRLKVYHAVDAGDVSVFLQDHSTPRDSFFQIDMSSTLEDALKGRVIIEYPTFHVVLPSHVLEYPTAVSNPVPKRQRLNEELRPIGEDCTNVTHSVLNNAPSRSTSLEHKMNYVTDGLEADQENVVQTKTFHSLVGKISSESNAENISRVKENRPKDQQGDITVEEAESKF